MARKHDIVICGAGICGVSAAYYLARQGITDILILDERDPLSLTSSRSTECYRNWWPDPEMLALMDRSIDLLEELAELSNNVFRLNRRGYLYVTADASKLETWKTRAERISALGAGTLRIHAEGDSTYQPNPTSGDVGLRGADLLIGSGLIRRFFPCLAEDAALGLHIRRAGWLDSVGLGNYLLNQAKQLGVRVESARVSGIDVASGAVAGGRLGNGETIHTSTFINAAGPYFKAIGEMAGLDLPVFTELHQKVAFRDHLGVIGRDLPLVIWDDPQTLDWSDEEREFLAEEAETRWMTEPFPAGAHTRPDGGADSPMAFMLWEYAEKRMEPAWPPPLDENYPEIVLHGLGRMIPGLKRYYGRAPKPVLDGGWYTKTRENRPLVGPTPVKGFLLCGAVSGYGIMAACGVGELLAAHVAGTELPAYAPAFALARYEDAEYVKGLESWGEDGQL
jgi:glycine/D-amino acid oxidase-like deaminating enzyme